VIAAAGGWLKANHIRQLQDIKGKVRAMTPLRLASFAPRIHRPNNALLYEAYKRERRACVSIYMLLA